MLIVFKDFTALASTKGSGWNDALWVAKELVAGAAKVARWCGTSADFRASSAVVVSTVARIAGSQSLGLNISTFIREQRTIISKSLQVSALFVSKARHENVVVTGEVAVVVLENEERM